MAQTLEDVLARRIRLLFLDARAAAEVAEDVARYIATELKKDENWVREQNRRLPQTLRAVPLLNARPSQTKSPLQRGFFRARATAGYARPKCA